MQFIAEDPVHVVVRNELPAVVDPAGRGVIRPTRRRLFAKFSRGTAPDWAREVGLRTFEFRRMPEGVTSSQWLSFYDSHEAAEQLGWTEEERLAIEAKLVTIDDVVVVEKPRLSPPWPAYDRLAATKGGLSHKAVVEKIVAKIEEDGYDAHEVLAYEHENKARKSVIAAIEQLLGAPASQSDVGELEEEEELIEA